MAKCNNCGKEVSAEWKACPFCGSLLKKTCAKCGKELDAGWKACPFCGALEEEKTVTEKEFKFEFSEDTAGLEESFDKQLKEKAEKQKPSLPAGVVDKEEAIRLYNSKEYAKALPSLLYHAEHDPDAEIMLLTGRCYFATTDCIEEDCTKAFYWIIKSAEQGNADAQTELGECYVMGFGTAMDEEKAFFWYTKSANQGHASGQNGLGNCYYYGRGTAKDYVKAFYWYTKAAEQGYADGQDELGNCYYYGCGTAKDYVKAFYWYTKAAEQGNRYAQYSLGWCYYHGQGVSKDTEKGIEWYKKAAKNGEIRAKDELKKLGIKY